MMLKNTAVDAIINMANARLTKCNFCQFLVGNECVATGVSGQVNSSYCRQAQYEYNQWLQKQKRSQTKSNSKGYKKY